MAGAHGARQCGIMRLATPTSCATSHERALLAGCVPSARSMAPVVSGLQPLGPEELAAARRAQAQQKRRNEALHRQVRRPLPVFN